MKNKFTKAVLKIFLICPLLLMGFIQIKAQTETLPAGALIINMGSATPTVDNSLRPYGLIWDIIKNDKAQVRWVISNSKLKDGIDFTYNTIDYRGGTFIIPAEFRTPSVNAKITALNAIINSVTTTSPLTVNVSYNLRYTPRWTFDFDNGNIAQGYLANANIPIDGFPMKKPSDLNGCDDLFVMPHADPVWSTHKNLLTWNQNAKGWIWGACHAVSAMENIYNPANPSEQLNFLSNRFAGFGADLDAGNTWAGNSLVLWSNHDDPLTAFSYTNPNDAEMQFIGTLTGGVSDNGSERGYMPYNPTSGGGAGRLASWRTSTTVAVFDGSAAATNPNIPEYSDGLVATVAYGRAFGDVARGKVMYESGHSHDGNSAPMVNAQRIFFNFSFLSVFDKDPVPVPVASNINVVSGETINLSVSVRSGFNLSNYNIYWSSACGGTFGNPFSATTTFKAPSTYPCGPCKLTVTITDGCGRQYYENITLTICPAPPVALDRTTNLINNPSGTGPQSIGAITPLAGTDQDGTIVSYTISSIPTAVQGVLSIACPTTPIGATCTSGFANLTPAVLAANPGGIVLTPAQAQSFRFDPADGFGGTATFNYTVTDNNGLMDATPAIYNIPVNPPPVAHDILSAPIPSNAGITPVPPALFATDNGTIVSYNIISLPPAIQGILYLNGVPVTAGQTLTSAQAAQLSFDPNGSFIGYAQVTYTATDNNGAVDATPATLSIQIVNQPPVAKDITAPVIANPNGTGQTAIPSLDATDIDGTIASYKVNSIPLVTEGVLYYFNGTSYVPVMGGQILTTAQAASLRFDPSDGYTGNASFTYSATDNLGLIDNTPATYNIPVGIIPPIANNIVNTTIYSGAGQTSINPLSGADPDATNIIVSFTVTAIPPVIQGILYYDNGGTYVPVSPGQVLTPAQAATLKFDPADGFSGNALFNYTVTDDEGLTDQSPAMFTIPINNQPPVATNILNPAISNTAGPTTVNPLAATDPDGSVANYTITSLPDPSKGILLLSGVPVVQGQVITPAQIALLLFDPAPGATGNAVFNFTATDDQGATDASPSSFTIPLTSLPVPPTTDDKLNAVINAAAGPTNILVLTGADTDGTIASFVINTIPPAVQGVLMLNGIPVTIGQIIPASLAGQLQFDPSGTYTGNAVFTYSTRDNDNLNDASPASFTIPIINNPPVANDITVNNVKTGSTTNLPSLTGSDNDGTIASYTISSLPTLGTLQVDLTGSGTYSTVTVGQVLTPAQAARLRFLAGSTAGTSVFTFTTTDNLGVTDATSANYSIPISSSGTLNQPPAVFNILNSAINANSGQTAINPLQGTDPDGSIETFTLLSIPPPSQGTLFYNNGTAFVPVTEGGLILTPIQMATLRFDPSGNFTGNVNFSYTANDNDGDIALHPANYTIPIINTPPAASNILNSSLNSSAGPTTISSLTATDVDGTVVQYRLTTVPPTSQGILYLDGIPVIEGQLLTPAEAARLQFDPNSMFSGNAIFTFTAIDNLNAADQTPATFTIPVINQPPVADDKISQLITNQNGTGQQTLPALTGFDTDGTIVNFTITNLPSNGILYFNGIAVTPGLVIPLAQANLLSFDPADGFSGNTTFNYTTTDNNGNVDATPALYTIRVNTPPITNNILAPAFYAGGANASIPTLIGTDDGSVQFYSITSLPPATQGFLYLNGILVTDLSQVDTLTPVQINQLSFTPAPTFTGTTFAYTATDNLGFIDVSPAVYTIPQKIIISGSVWNDSNGGITIDGSEGLINGTNTGGGITTGAVLYVNLIDASGNVAATVSVLADGSYTFPTVLTNTDYTVQLTLNQGTIGQPKPITLLPSGWVTTGENKNNQGGLPDTNSNTEIMVNTNNGNILNQNFGIERLPESSILSAVITTPILGQIITLNGGANPPILSGSDPEDQPANGILTNKSIQISAIPLNSELYYNGVLVTAGQTILNFNPSLLTIKFTAATIGATSTSFTYAYVDAAGKVDPTPATYNLSWLGALPVDFLNFTVNKVNNTSILNFEISQPVQGSVFTIERSTTGTGFTAIGSLNSTNATRYTYTDAVPVQNAKNYYRIKETDARGQVIYSIIRLVKFTKDIKIDIYPIPASTNINITFNDAMLNQPITIALYNAQGQEVIRKFVNHANATETIGIQSFTNGVYQLRILNNATVVTERKVVIMK